MLPHGSLNAHVEPVELLPVVVAPQLGGAAAIGPLQDRVRSSSSLTSTHTRTVWPSCDDVAGLDAVGIGVRPGVGGVEDPHVEVAGRAPAAVVDEEVAAGHDPVEHARRPGFDLPAEHLAVEAGGRLGIGRREVDEDQGVGIAHGGDPSRMVRWSDQASGRLRCWHGRVRRQSRLDPPVARRRPLRRPRRPPALPTSARARHGRLPGTRRRCRRRTRPLPAPRGAADARVHERRSPAVRLPRLAVRLRRALSPCRRRCRACPCRRPATSSRTTRRALRLGVGVPRHPGGRHPVHLPRHDDPSSAASTTRSSVERLGHAP